MRQELKDYLYEDLEQEYFYAFGLADIDDINLDDMSKEEVKDRVRKEFPIWMEQEHLDESKNKDLQKILKKIDEKF